MAIRAWMGAGPRYGRTRYDRPRYDRRRSNAELFAQDALVEAVAGIEQHVHGNAVIHADLDGAHRAHLVVVGDGGDRALVGFEHLDGDLGAVGQQRAAPAPRSEWADR